MPDLRHVAFTGITAIAFFATLYSVSNNTYLDTSNPLVAHLPHPLHHQSYFARKGNFLNVYFIKKAWGWTTFAFLSLYFTSPSQTRTSKRLSQYVIATAVWLLFTGWFFGPAIIDRIVVLSGGECVVRLPHGAVISVPHEHCELNTMLSPDTHPQLFAGPALVPGEDWRSKPRYMRGHDVSGHIFLLTMSVLFLADQIRQSLLPPTSSFQSATKPPGYSWALTFNVVLITIWLFSTFTTCLYFHTPWEKLSGYFLGLSGFLATQLPIINDRVQNRTRERED